MTGMISEQPDGTPAVSGSGVATTTQLRQMAANAVRLRLPYQLDFRLDTVLDSDGSHIISLHPDGQQNPFDYDSADDAFARCYAHLKFTGVTDPFEMTLDFRVRDYLALTPVGGPPRRTRGVKTDVQFRHMIPDADTPGPSPLGGF